MSETLQQRYDRWKARAIALLPKGAAWPRISGASLPDVVGAASAEFARVEASTDVYRTEMDPSQTDALLPEWERALSLPDACGLPATDDGRRGAIVARLTGGGTNTRASLEAAVLAFAADTTLADVVWSSQFEMGTDGACMGCPIGSDPWAATATLAIETTDESLDEAGLECVLNGMRRGHALFLFAYYDPEATFRGLQFTFSGPNYTSWLNAGDVTPLPSAFFGTVPSGSINGENALDFTGAETMATTDDWTDYASVEAQYAALALEVDAVGSPEAIFYGSLSFGLTVEDDGGPVLTGFSYDGGPGIYTPQVSLVLGRTYVVDLLHVDDVMTLRVYDATVGTRTVSVDAPASTFFAGSLGIGPFDGRMAGLSVYGARGRVPKPADREALFNALIAQYT